MARSPTAMRAIGKGKKNDNEPSGETKTSGRCYQLQMVSCIVFLSRDRGYFHFLANSGSLLWVVLPLRNGREKRVCFYSCLCPLFCPQQQTTAVCDIHVERACTTNSFQSIHHGESSSIRIGRNHVVHCWTGQFSVSKNMIEFV